MEFIGYSADKQPLCVFQYVTLNFQAELLLYDHRDNSPQAGGFAFSVYHPGTGLP